ncbi:MAG: enoyl-CoA hydratase-related protein [Candidatus Hodarchaeales archaeon]|jgi:methylglutaconyl-CoA hydratase
MFPSYDHIATSIDEKKVAIVKINRPEVHNAFNEKLIKEMTECGKLIENSDIRVVILTGEGRSFCAGADLNYMRKSKDFTFDENVQDASAMAEMFHVWNNLSKPIIGRINGTAIGGGIGLVAACDIAIASSNAKFGFSEVKLGIIPAVISPFVIRKIGVTAARELFLTGAQFNADTAQKIYLINYTVPDEDLDTKVNEISRELLSSGPLAIKESKELIKKNYILNNEELVKYTVAIIAELRQSDEGQEGIDAFFSKRSAKWVK